jgi:uncharacterized paraquat-inducible protein A
MSFSMLRYAYLLISTRLSALHDDERGITTLEAVLWIGGLAVLAIGTVAAISALVGTATNKIPTGPAAGGAAGG